MLFKIQSELTYEVYAPTTYIFNIQAAKTASQTILDESITLTPDLKFEEFTLYNSETRFIKMQINYGTFTITYKANVEVPFILTDESTVYNTLPFIEMDNEVLPYISPSRYCESDKLMQFANKEFGHLTTAYAKAEAINNWVFNSIQYISGSTNSNISACDTLISRIGVCKDFAHVAIALCRALDIPARYCTGYASDLIPPDIHASFEAYIGNQWHLFDPTGLSAKNGFVKIAHGKDAAEAAVATYFGSTFCSNMIIQCDMVL